MKLLTCLILFFALTTKDVAAEAEHLTEQRYIEKMLLLEQQFNELENKLTQAQITILKLEQKISKMDENSVLALDGFLKLELIDGHPTAVFNAINLQVNSGSGRTDRTVNGLGNLIIGYNESSSNSPYFCSDSAYNNQSLCTASGHIWNNNVRRGSHNLIIGANNSYDDYGSIVSGVGHTANASYSNILGGLANHTAARYSNVSGGRYNETHALFSSISGGYDNITSGKYSSVSGGRRNTASGDYSSVSGGQLNTASGQYSSVTSGSGNQATETGASVTGGQSNTANGFMSNVSGGAIRVESGYNAWRAGNLRQDY